MLLIIPLLSIGAKADEKTDAIDKFVAKHEDTLSGAAVAVIDNGEITTEKAYGYADIQKKIKVDRDTVFEWGSCSKLLVWVSVMQLEEQGKLDLNKDIRGYLPEGFLKNLKYDMPITMLNLMNHNAGFSDLSRDLLITDSSKLLSLEDALKKYQPEQIYRPGTTVAYSNFGAALAGYIVELISGKPYWKYVNENIFKPLGMEHTSVEAKQADNPWVKAQRNLIKGYSTERKYMDTQRAYISLYPAGSAIGTIDDMARFSRAFIPVNNEKTSLFQRPSTVDKLLKASLCYSDGTPRIAHGFFYEQYSDGTFGHEGNTVAFSAKIAFSPKSHRALCIMTNTSQEETLITGLPEIVFGKKVYNYSGKLPEVKGVNGVYFYARREANTFNDMLTWTTPFIVKELGNNQLSIAGSICKQVAPYYFVGDGMSVHFNVVDGKIVSFSKRANSDEIPTNFVEVIAIYSLLVLFLIGIIYFIVLLMIKSILWIISKAKKTVNEKNKLKGLVNWFAILYIIFIINTVIMEIRSMTYTMYSYLIPHFIINTMVLPLCLVYWVLVIKNFKEYKKGKVNAIITGLFWAILCTTIVCLNLWR